MGKTTDPMGALAEAVCAVMAEELATKLQEGWKRRAFFKAMFE